MAAHPERIGKYAITRALGKGAMGMVYEGFDPVIERKVAIKTILADYLDPAEMQEAVARFRREAQAGGRLQHPGIVAVYEYGNDGDMAFIVMEYAEGRELKAVLAEGRRFEVIEIFEVMKQLLVALDYSHRQGVVHRDIKPANLMVLPGPKVKVMDFGIARLESSNLTQVGTVVGTPTHMAPEQLMGLPADGRVDLWASGVILYELLTGASPFIAESPARVMHNVLQATPPPPTSVNPSLPAGFDGTIARALAKKPEERFQTAREFQAALLMALQGKDVSATMTLRTQTAIRPPEPVPVLALSPEVLADIERSLSRHVGPLAGVLVRKGRAEAKDFGALLRLLAEHIPDTDEQAAFMKKAPERAAAEADVVVICVPIRQTVPVIRKLGPLLRPDALLMDVTSLKGEPMQAMLDSFNGSVLGTHPLFGPGVHSFQGQRVVLCQGRGEPWQRWLVELLEGGGMVITEASPAEHDRMMALVQVLTHYQTQVMGLALARLGTPPVLTRPFTSPAYLLELYVTARHFAQSAGLYGPIEMLNPRTPEVTAAFQEAAAELAEVLGAGDQARFDRIFEEVRGFFGGFTEEALEQSRFLIDRLVERSMG